MPAASAHTRREEADEAGELSLQDRPINLVDISRVLGESAKAERLGDLAIRAWRDDLTVIRDSLSYARAILEADAAILLEAGSQEKTEREGLVDELPAALVARAERADLAARAAEEAPALAPEPVWSDQDALDFDPDIDEGLFIRSDHLLAAHREMATVDLASPTARGRVLELVEAQLALLTERQAAVEARLQQIRSLIYRRYRDAAAPAQDQPA